MIFVATGVFGAVLFTLGGLYYKYKKDFKESCLMFNISTALLWVVFILEHLDKMPK